MKKNILLLLISTIVILAICEVAIRLVLPQINDHDVMFQFEETVGWEFIPNKKGAIVYEGGINHTIQINGEGYRDVPFEEKKGATKIMVLGDSFVSNISVEADEVFTKLMENKLTDTSVYNFGVNGYGQIQEYLVLKEWAPKIQPDVIVVMVYLRNDFTDNMSKNPWLYPRPSAVFNTDMPVQIIPPSKKYTTKEALPFYYKSHLYRLVKNSISNIKSKNDTNKNIAYTPPEVYTCRDPLEEDTKLMYETMERLLIAIDDYGKDANIPVVFALAPSMVQVEDDLWSQIEDYYPSVRYKKDMPNATLLAFAKANQLKIIDLMPALQEADRNGIKMYNAQEQHWTVEGNKVVADVLSKHIKQTVVHFE
ncbi:hypothetical protein [uncultured Dokdonia sp.]|uniref:alginate O-acetyltransferase AlgX-related protein n=1 Tax=uncultured Dokdonia sp. TaxID=575653 RepID=UPI0026070149|nr:hypothetical protein [uncultured Dokdonia sp.]